MAIRHPMESRASFEKGTPPSPWRRSVTLGGSSRSSRSPGGPGEALEIETLQRQLKEMEELAKMRVEAAKAEVSAAKLAQEESSKKVEALTVELGLAREAEVKARELTERGKEQEEHMGQRAEIAASEIAMAKMEAKAAKRAEADALWQLNALLGTKEVLEGELKKWREESVVRRRTMEAMASRHLEQEEAERNMRVRLAADALIGTDRSQPGSRAHSGPLSELLKKASFRSKDWSKSKGDDTDSPLFQSIEIPVPQNREGERTVASQKVENVKGKEVEPLMGEKDMIGEKDMPKCGCVIQ